MARPRNKLFYETPLPDFLPPEKEWLREAAYRLGNQMNGAYERNPHILENISIDFSEGLFWRKKLTSEAPDLSLTTLKRQVSDSES